MDTVTNTFTATMTIDQYTQVLQALEERITMLEGMELTEIATHTRAALAIMRHAWDQASRHAAHQAQEAEHRKSNDQPPV